MTNFYDNSALDKKLLLARAWVEHRRIWSPRCFKSWLGSQRRLSAEVQR